MRPLNIGKIAAAILAHNFNRLLDISEGYFGSSPRSPQMGAGEQRAIARLQEHRKAQAERLKDAKEAPPSRQQKRRAGSPSCRRGGEAAAQGVDARQCRVITLT